MSLPLPGRSLSRILHPSEDLVSTVASFFFFISQYMNLKLHRELRVFLVFPLFSSAQVQYKHIYILTSSIVENVHPSSRDLTLR